MTYNVFSGTLNLTQLLSPRRRASDSKRPTAVCDQMAQPINNFKALAEVS